MSHPASSSTPSEGDAHGEASASLADASARLEAALGRLEALIQAGPLQSELFRRPGPEGDATQVLQAELAAVRVREYALETAAAAASRALGRAVADVKQALAEDASEGPDDLEASATLDPTASVEDGKE